MPAAEEDASCRHWPEQPPKGPRGLAGRLLSRITAPINTLIYQYNISLGHANPPLFLNSLF